MPTAHSPICGYGPASVSTLAVATSVADRATFEYLQPFHWAHSTLSHLWVWASQGWTTSVAAPVLICISDYWHSCHHLNTCLLIIAATHPKAHTFKSVVWSDRLWQWCCRYNQKMLVFSVLFTTTAWFLTKQIGSVGFILANCLNMLLRIAHRSGACTVCLHHTLS